MNGSNERSTAAKLELFGRCFTGLTHVYGTYDVRTGRVRQVKEPVTKQVILAHLQGRQSYGVYLLVQDQTRGWRVKLSVNWAWGWLQFTRSMHLPPAVQPRRAGR